MADKQDNSREIEKWLKLIRADSVGPTTFTKNRFQNRRKNSCKP
ncbi:MAG: hypothetical protein ACYSQZ_07250 [Planctomycetota bacterium]